MKKSDEIKAAIEEIDAERGRQYEVMVKNRPGRTEENHDRYFADFYNACGRELCKKKTELEDSLRRELNREIEVGDGVTKCLWSDRQAGTVIARTAKTLTIRRDKASLDPSFKPEWEIGGFSAICTNAEEQKWTYEPDPDGEITRFHWSEKNGCWQSGDDGSIRLARGRHEYYDYNF